MLLMESDNGVDRRDIQAPMNAAAEVQHFSNLLQIHSASTTISEPHSLWPSA